MRKGRQYGNGTTHNNHIDMGEGGEDGGGNSDDGNDYNEDNNDARKQMLPQTERTTGTNICCRLQRQCSSRNNGSMQQSKMTGNRQQRLTR